ncbi:co-chaperone protein daf-41 [Galendromus occidentalis]|uniref:Co-chaperone protein daf-41 n=1 Tax=Galendromus occidentalis TaxID=34638 RepID=A0AAJ6QJM3_9ACAR|nr:co-chaperone protein daf-41 [Galendromus occidentalis]
MTGSTDVRNPVVLWAQRRDCVYITIAVEDCKNADLKIEADKVLFKGDGGDKLHYACALNLNNKVKNDESKFVVRDRNIEVLLKKEEEQYWPRLLKESTKMHWLRVDFNKWRDEDESDDELGGGGGGNFEDMMRQMGGLGGGAGMGGFDGAEEEDSDDDELPDLESAKDNKEEERKE